MRLAVCAAGHGAPVAVPGTGVREALMYRVYLFEELTSLVPPNYFRGRTVLEIGPKDGLDSKRLQTLGPSRLVMIDLPEKAEGNRQWLGEIVCPHEYIEANFMYLPSPDWEALGRFDLIWCTGVLYHNPEQLRMLRKLYRRLEPGGYLVLESATLRAQPAVRDGCYVEIHYPRTYRDTGTVSHLPTAKAIEAWLRMAGFRELHRSHCFQHENADLCDERMACICRKGGQDEGDIYYAKTGKNPPYRFGDST